MQGICTFPFQGAIRPYHFRKSILKDIHGNNIATYSHAQECNDPVLIQIIQNFIVDHPLKSNQANTPNNLILNKEYRGIKLSPLESNCLFYLIRQKPKSEIAKLLNLPLNIISQYIENIKAQLNAGNISDILEISIAKGFINIVPPGIFNQLYPIQYPALSNNIQKMNSGVNGYVKFTNRELDCAKLLIKGCRIKEIAKIINLSPRTVETHINNLKIKFDCRDKIELIIKLRDML
jgi:DNA-binding CsgD family transcriptional regulator